MNKSLAQELYQEECVPLARQKEAIQQKEELLQRRLEAILNSAVNYSSSATFAHNNGCFPLRTFGIDWNTTFRRSNTGKEVEGDVNGLPNDVTSFGSDSQIILEGLEKLRRSLLQRKGKTQGRSVASRRTFHQSEGTDEENEEGQQVKHQYNQTEMRSSPSTIKEISRSEEDSYLGPNKNRSTEEEEEPEHFPATQLPAKKKRKIASSKNIDNNESNGDDEDDVTSVYLFQTQKDPS